MPNPNRVAALLLATAMLASATGCAASRGTSSAAASGAELAALERERFAAMTAVDLPRLEALLAADLTYCHSTGVCESREQFLDSLRTRRRVYQHIEVEQLTPRVSAGLAVINGVIRTEVLANGAPRSLRLVFTDVYTRGAAGWQLRAWQSTNAPAE